MVKVYTSYYGNARKIPKDLVPVAISGKIPEWWNGPKYEVLAPKYSFFKIWKETQDNDYYIDHYKKLVLGNVSINQVLIDLGNITMSFKMEDGTCYKGVVLLCYETPEKFCHRHLVADWMNYYGYECKELEQNDL